MRHHVTERQFISSLTNRHFPINSSPAAYQYHTHGGTLVHLSISGAIIIVIASTAVLPLGPIVLSCFVSVFYLVFLTYPAT